jgi:hypothetical protein
MMGPSGIRVLCAFVVGLAATSAMAAQASTGLTLTEERLIVQTVLQHPTTIDLFGTRKMRVARDTALPTIHDTLSDPKGLSIRRYDSGVIVQVSEKMLEHRRSNNRKSWSTAGLTLPPRRTHDPSAPGTEVWERITVSRPGISEDGLSAIVAITRSDWASAGFTVYLEKTGGAWKVVGEGGDWVV